MKHLHYCFVAFLFAITVISCNKEPKEPPFVPTLTVKTGAANVDETDVTLSGSFTYDGKETVSAGFRYAKDKAALAAAQVIPATMGENGSFSLTIESLENGEYWYRASAQAQGGEAVEGAEGFFKVDFSLVPTVTTGVADITAEGYQLSGSYSFSSKKVQIKVGFFYAASQEALATAQLQEVKPAEDGQISYLVPISFGPSCYFQAGAIVNGVEYRGEVKNAGFNDLSASGDANCFIIKQDGWYSFKAVKPDGTAVDANSANWLWATEEGLISNVSTSEGRVYFKINRYAQASIVVAALNASGSVLWNWHLWLTDASDMPTLNGITFMDRNLGANSKNANEAASIGLMYQWGRKDPFIGTKIMDRDISASLYESEAFSLDESKERCWCAPYVINNEVGITFSHVGQGMTEALAAENPMVHYGQYAKGGYSMTNDEIKDFWGAVSGTKTNNDPCPAGYKVPKHSDYTGYINTGLIGEGATSVYGKTAEGKNSWGRIYTLDGVEYNWPGTGWRAWSGVIARPGSAIAMSSANLRDVEFGVQVYWNWGTTPGSNFTCEAFPLRCVKM